MLDLSAAFDTVDHGILLRRLTLSYGLTGSAHSWFWSYLNGRTQHVRLGSTTSSITRLICGVPQGSVLGPILFVLYTADLLRLIERHDLQGHLYADDTQVLGSCPLRDIDVLQARLSACLDDVASWMVSNRLQLNTDKTELLWCATARRQAQLPKTPIRVGTCMVSPATSVRDLGIYIDADISGRTHVAKTISACFAALRRLQSIRRSIPSTVYRTLVVSLVLSRFDYGNAALCGLPDYMYRRLQSVINAAARSIFRLRRFDHVSPALVELHWLSAADRVTFKVATLVYRCLHEAAPRYLSSALHRVADVDTRRRLRSSADTQLLVTPRSRLVTAGDRSFLVAGPRIWNSLPSAVRAAPSLLSFKQRLKTFYFRVFTPDSYIACL
jgi:hypothetical protein